MDGVTDYYGDVHLATLWVYSHFSLLGIAMKQNVHLYNSLIFLAFTDGYSAFDALRSDPSCKS